MPSINDVQINPQLQQLIVDLQKTLDEANWFKKLFFPRNLRNALKEPDQLKRIGKICDVLIFLNPWGLQYWLFPILRRIQNNATVIKLKTELKDLYDNDMCDRWLQDKQQSYFDDAYLNEHSVRKDWADRRLSIIIRNNPDAPSDLELAYYEVYQYLLKDKLSVKLKQRINDIWEQLNQQYPDNLITAAKTVKICLEFKNRLQKIEEVIETWSKIIEIVVKAKNPENTITAFQILKQKELFNTKFELLMKYWTAVSQKELPFDFANTLLKLSDNDLENNSDLLIQYSLKQLEIFKKKKETYTEVQNVTKKHENVTIKLDGVTKKHENVTNELDNITNKHKKVTFKLCGVTKKHENVTKKLDLDNVTNELDNVTNELDNVTKELDNVTKELDNVTKDSSKIRQGFFITRQPSKTQEDYPRRRNSI